MKKNLFLILVMALLVFPLFSCGEIEEPPVTPDLPNEDDPKPVVPPVDEDGVEYSVSLIYEGMLYIPSGEEVTVVWADDYSQYTKEIDSTGYAKIILDGDFQVYLNNLPSGYTYDPNIYHADNDNPTIEIELLKIYKISKGRGTGLYQAYEVTTPGTYRTTITSANKKVYYEYFPKTAGVYTVESIVNINEDLINPKLDVHQGSTQWKNPTPEIIDGGGTYKPGGFTKNFKWNIYIADEMIGGVYTFVIYAESKTGVYPVDVDFRITYEGEHYLDHPVSKVMYAEEAGFKTKDYPGIKYYNSDGGTGSYYNSVTNGTGLLDGKNFKYNPEDGYWHVWYNDTQTYGPILCASITTPCAYYEESLNNIESHGNKNLTVSNSTENYKQFIEVSYAAACNSDGVCYVTMELKEFLQKFSVSQRLFIDGNGFVESTGVYAIEEDQWLFCCGYYDSLE